MSAYEFILFAAGAAIAWLLMAYQARHEQKHADAVGSVCEGVDGAWCGKRCEAEESLCASCKRLKRAREIRGESR